MKKLMILLGFMGLLLANNVVKADETTDSYDYDYYQQNYYCSDGYVLHIPSKQETNTVGGICLISLGAGSWLMPGQDTGTIALKAVLSIGLPILGLDSLGVIKF